MMILGEEEVKGSIPDGTVTTARLLIEDTRIKYPQPKSG